jgi:pilus assembly protein CpaE
MEPTLVSVRDALRFLALPPGPTQIRRPVIVLNRLGQPGGLSRRKVESALKAKVDVVIPDMPRVAELAATLGEAVSKSRNSFRRGVEELARLTAFVRLLDAGVASPTVAAPEKGGLLRRLFGG